MSGRSVLHRQRPKSMNPNRRKADNNACSHHVPRSVVIGSYLYLQSGYPVPLPMSLIGRPISRAKSTSHPHKTKLRVGQSVPEINLLEAEAPGVGFRPGRRAVVMAA